MLILGGLFSGLASLVPGGSTALGIVQGVTGAGAPRGSRKGGPKKEARRAAGTLQAHLAAGRPRPSVAAQIIPQIQKAIPALAGASLPAPAPTMALPRLPIPRLPIPTIPGVVGTILERVIRRPAPIPTSTGVSAMPRCVFPFRTDANGDCFLFGNQAGLEPGGVGGGNPVMGRYGAGLVPDVETRTVRDCLPGMVLGNDGVCYNRRDIRNSDRQWPKGRAPLLTGGERNAITKARAAARKIENTTKALQAMGMIKKPPPRGRKTEKVRYLPAPGTSIVNVE